MNDYEIRYQFSDPGVSGKRFENRPEFMKMITLAEQKKIDVVAVYSLSRFGRNLKDTLKWIDFLEKKDVAFYTQDFQVDTRTSHGKLMLQMIAAFAEFESNQRGELITSVMSHLKKERKVYCGVTPLGFNKVDGKLIPDDSEMKIVRMVYDLKGGGLTYKDIARELNKQGIKGKRGGTIESTTITKILRNNIYEGII
jgi:site-specific DNA recombinase